MSSIDRANLEIFSTTPQSKDFPREIYLQQVIKVARWSEEAGHTAILVYTDNSIVDPWLVAHIILQNTTRLAPLVAVQPAYMHPYTVAKMVASFGHLYGRRIFLNMVAGGFKNDLLALNDTTPHDDRYTRLIEYTTIIKRLLSSPAPVSFEGKFYKVEGLKMTPALAPGLFPGILMSGSSDAGFAAARALSTGFSARIASDDSFAVAPATAWNADVDFSVSSVRRATSPPIAREDRLSAVSAAAPGHPALLLSWAKAIQPRVGA